jgi:hypothetical protein
MTRALGAEDPATLTVRSDLARWSGMPEKRPRRATSTPISCESGNGVSAPGTR